MLAILSNWWAIATVALLAIALESLWFSSLWLGAWLPEGRQDRTFYERFTLRRFGITLFASLSLAAILSSFMVVVYAGTMSLFEAGVTLSLLASLVLLHTSVRERKPVRQVVAEMSFVIVLLITSTHILYYWPW